MIEYWLKNTSQSQDTSKFKFSVTWWKITFTYTKETAQSKEGIKKWLRKLHQTFQNQFEAKFTNQQLKLQKPLDIIMQVL